MAPAIAPANCAAIYGNTLFQSKSANHATASVTAGFKCPLPPRCVEAYTPTNTAIAQPNVITIHPLLFPFVLFSTTLATTPSPRIISKAVPTNSPRNGDINFNLWLEDSVLLFHKNLLTAG